jgi:hypothetical protein
MTIDQPNPYASPMAISTGLSDVAIDPVLLAKAETIIKDAGQFWIAILMCVLCTGLGSIIIGPWYLVRLMQWNALARSQPMLVDASAPVGSIAYRFRSAKTKLIIGICFGATILLFVALAVVVLLASA